MEDRGTNAGEAETTTEVAPEEARVIIIREVLDRLQALETMLQLWMQHPVSRRRSQSITATTTTTAAITLVVVGITIAIGWERDGFDVSIEQKQFLSLQQILDQSMRNDIG
jgi:hypothetical protein